MNIRFLGRLLRSRRAGMDNIAWHHPSIAHAPELITLSSPAFADETAIPQRHAGKGVGDDVSPALRWTGIPTATAELVLIVEDPDAPLRRPIVHAVVTGIPPTTTALAESALDAATDHPEISIGTGAFGRRGYAGPRPIPGHGPHRYVFQLFALDRPTGLGPDATLASVLKAIDGHVLARGKLTGIYER